MPILTEIVSIGLFTGKIPYLDPGSGSFLFQLLIAVLTGIGIFIGVSWKRIKRFFYRGKNQDEATEEGEEDDD